MPAATTLLLVALGLPALAAVLIGLTGRWPNLREGVTLSAAGALALCVGALALAVHAGARPAIELAEPFPGLAIAFAIEPLGMLFGLVAGVLWLVTSVYSIGYMRALREHDQTRYYACFAVALAAAQGLAYSANLLTLFVCYELLTLSTWPLVAHHGDGKSLRGGRVYILMLMGTSIGLLLPAMVWTYVAAGTLDFRAGGILAGKVEAGLLPLLLGLYAYGIGKVALMPLHRWLPAAMVAPTPVSALLHAVAVVKAGAFTVLKVVVYVFGVDLLADTGASVWLAYVAAGSLVLASLIALGRDNLKARLAYSTVSQLAYVVLGAALASAAGVLGGGMQIAAHALGKITLFFCAGAIYVASGKTEVSELDGLGRTMPVTFGCFLLGALSIVGLPPLGGTWAKWYLITAALDGQHLVLAAALLLSSLLSAAYLLSVVARAFFLPAARPLPAGADVARTPPGGEAPLACLVPIVLCATGAVTLFFAADAVRALLAPLIAGP